MKLKDKEFHNWKNIRKENFTKRIWTNIIKYTINPSKNPFTNKNNKSIHHQNQVTIIHQVEIGRKSNSLKFLMLMINRDS